MSKLIPNTTQTPNFFLDDVMHMLTGEETKVLLYTIRRTLGFQQRSSRISLSQYANGITRQDGRRLDHGTGLSVPAVRKAIGALINFGIMKQVADNDPHKNEGPKYELQLDEDKMMIDRLRERYVMEEQKNVQRTTKARNTLAARQTPYSATEGVQSDNMAPLQSDNTPALQSDYNIKERLETKKETKVSSTPAHAVEPTTDNQKSDHRQTKTSHGTRLTIQDLPDDWRSYCASKRPDLDPALVWENFRDYWIAQPGQKGRKTDWLATWRTWVRNQRTMPTVARTNGPKPVPAQPRYEEPAVKPRVTLKDLEKQR